MAAANTARSKLVDTLATAGMKSFEPSTMEDVEAIVGSLDRKDLFEILRSVADCITFALPDKLSKKAILEGLALVKQAKPAAFDDTIAALAGEEVEENEENDEENDDEEKEELPPPNKGPSPNTKTKTPAKPTDTTPDAALRRMDRMESQMSQLVTMMKDLQKSKKSTDSGDKVKALRKAQDKEDLEDIMSEASETDVNDEQSCATSLRTRTNLVKRKKREDEDAFLYAHLAVTMTKKDFTMAWSNSIRDYRVKRVRETERDTQDIVLLKDNLTTIVEVYNRVNGAIARHRLIQSFIANTEHLLLILLKISSKDASVTCSKWNEELLSAKKAVKKRKIDFVDYHKVIEAAEEHVKQDAQKNRNAEANRERARADRERGEARRRDAQRRQASLHDGVPAVGEASPGTAPKPGGKRV